MLNRRNLRIKAMQALFAYSQSKQSDFEIAIQNIKDHFGPDPNSLEATDPDELKINKNFALKSFLGYFETGKFNNDSPEILGVVQQEVKVYNTSMKNDRNRFKDQMMEGIGSIERTYFSILQLMVIIAEMANGIKLPGNLSPVNLVKNLLIAKIKYDKKFQDVILNNKITWDDEMDIVKNWYSKYIKNNPELLDYVSLDKTDFETDKEIVNHIMRQIIFKNETLRSYFEEKDLHWTENHTIVKSMVKKTIKDTEEKSELKLAEISLSLEEDLDFFEKLFEETSTQDEKLDLQISEKIKNWEIERVALVDKIILRMAVTELKNFPSIPVKVTINEYIEISKLYSTPKSKQFINGVLDVLAKDLQLHGEAKKSGRGLIDNK